MPQQQQTAVIPENIAGITTSLSKLRSDVTALHHDIVDVAGASSHSLHALVDIGFRTIQGRIDDAAREIDALRVQLAEARGLLLQHQSTTSVPPHTSGIKSKQQVNFDGQFSVLLKRRTDNPIVTGDEHYQDDLGMDSLEALEFVMMIEDVYAIKISDSDIDWLKTPCQLADYLMRTHNVNVYAPTTNKENS